MVKILDKLGYVVGTSIIVSAIWGGIICYNLSSAIEEHKKSCRQSLFERADVNRDMVLSSDEKSKMYQIILQMPLYELDGHGFSAKELNEYLKDYEPAQ